LQLRAGVGVAVGQGGLVLVSTGTRGSTWDYADLKLPQGAQAAWDFHAVHGVGQHIWAVGRPGSVALHSPDLGGHWEVVRTGQPLPLHGLFFRDEQHGWAVGELGTILSTADGGKSWQAQRRGGQQAAVLFVHARATGVPLDTVALVGGADGYLAAGVRVTAPDPATAAVSRAAEGDRFCDAVRQAGGAAGEMLWQFPLPTHLTGAGSQDLLRAWDVVHGGQAAQHLLGQLVLALRTWRPAVVVTDPPDGGAAGRAEDALLAEALAEAFRRAADPQAFPEQLSVLGLEPWQASKLYGRWEGPQDAPVTLDLTAISARLGTTAREFAAGPSALLQEGPVGLPAERRYRLLADRLEGAAYHHDLMQGLNLPPGGPARRAVVAVEEPTPEQVKALRQQANLRALAEASPGGSSNLDRLLAQVGPMLEDLPDDQAAPAAHAVAMQYVRLGQWELARELFLLLVERYPTHPLAADACRWLIYHSSSSEARRRHELGQFLVLGQLQVGVPHERARPTKTPAPPGEPLPKGFEKPQKKSQKAGPNKAHEPPDIPEFTAQSTGQLMHLASQEQTRKWYQGSLDLEPRLAGFGPLLATDPAVQFCLQAARRNLGDFDTAQQWYRQFVARQPDGPWRRAAAAELWLLNRSGPCPKPVMVCRHTDTRPFLDGKLDDPCWQGGSALKLTSAAGDTLAAYPTEVRLTYDRDYLYLAVRCGHPAGKQVPRAKVRTRDQDLRGHDRVSLLLDLDRDYATCFHLQVDERGCVAEDCWGDKTWDPRWFVAVHSGPQEWVLEAAIPLSALTGDTVTAGRAWAANVVRVLPGRGVQALSLPAEAPEEALRPEGMALLLFAQDPTQPVADRPDPAMSRAP
jgi:tetratricopeptide (TPR) repeat protein